MGDGLTMGGWMKGGQTVDGCMVSGWMGEG